MKLTFLFYLLCISSAFAYHANSQTAHVNIHADNMQAKEIISLIEEQTDYLFVYNNENVDLSHKVSMNTSNASVAEVLKIMFRNSDVIYAMQGNNILLMKSNMLERQQQAGKEITGKVTDANGEVVIGANVVEKGTTNGTITGVDGNYILNISPSSVLQISYIGYITKEVAVGNKSIINIKLTEDSKVLEEVVVVGYGTQKKEVVTGAITTLKANEYHLRVFTTQHLSLFSVWRRYT